MKSESRKSVQSAVRNTTVFRHFPEMTMKQKSALTAELVRHLMQSVFPPRNRKKSSASFTATLPNKRHTAATFAHVCRFSCHRKVTPFAECRHTGATVGLLRHGIYYTIARSVFPRYFGRFSRLLLFTLCGILCTTEAENRTENTKLRRKNE